MTDPNFCSVFNELSRLEMDAFDSATSQVGEEQAKNPLLDELLDSKGKMANFRKKYEGSLKKELG